MRGMADGTLRMRMFCDGFGGVMVRLLSLRWECLLMERGRFSMGAAVRGVLFWCSEMRIFSRIIVSVASGENI